MSSAINLFSEKTKNWFEEYVGVPTLVQEEGWPAIAAGKNALISAPTGTGKTLCAFLVFIDKLENMAAAGELEDKLYLIYISPLKSLGNDIKENLGKPIAGIGANSINVAVRTGDTTPYERQKMIKKPPHILITTPESLFILLTSKNGIQMLKTAQTIIIDELHALINSKRGAHLMLSLARLDKLCPKPLQRIGLSATIRPLDTAAEYLAYSQNVEIVAPDMVKNVDVEVNAPLLDMHALPEGTIWPELARVIYEYAQNVRTVMVFVEGRAFAEKLSYYINRIGGEGFSRTHHSCVSKEQRHEAEEALRSGQLRVMCATSSMELGIDVGEIDLVMQIGFPRTVSSSMQRIGRAGHNPGRVSVMRLLPRTQAESVFCGISARLTLDKAVEASKPPVKCFDILAQHLVSMATEEGYTVSAAMELISNTYTFNSVTEDELKNILAMLAGDYEHRLDHPSRPRILYDRINGNILGDAYSRMLALNSGGTIPDKGAYSVRLQDGTKIGELDEEFVFEARVGDKFMLGAFSWKIAAIDKDKVTVTQSSVEGAQPPFWRSEKSGRDYATGIEFGKILNKLTKAYYDDRLFSELRNLKLDDFAINNAIEFLVRQIQVTGILPDNETIIVEHFKDKAGESQITVHSLFGRRVNAGLAILVMEEARRQTGMDIHCYEDDDGFLVFPYGGRLSLPKGLLNCLDPQKAKPVLSAILPRTPLFNMAFRYNASRSLMLGIRRGKRQPLWIQRLKGAEILDGAIIQKNHPLMQETTRECMEDYWDIPAIIDVIEKINSGLIKIKEIDLETPSPMSLPFRRQVEADLTYDYFPTTSAVHNEVEENLQKSTMPPEQEQLDIINKRGKLPENKEHLHSLIMMEGDIVAGELELPFNWFEELAKANRLQYIEPGLWVCSEHLDEYLQAFENDDFEAKTVLVRRLLRYKGGQDPLSVADRYFWEYDQCERILDSLVENEAAVKHDGVYYHGDLYKRAQKATINIRRREVVTNPPEKYQHMLIKAMEVNDEPKEQLRAAIKAIVNTPVQISMVENIYLPGRVRGYKPALLDAYLSLGEVYWQFSSEKDKIVFREYAAIDWENHVEYEAPLSNDENIILNYLKTRGASFSHAMALEGDGRPMDILMELMEKGLVHADNFAPVRQFLSKDKLAKANVKQRAKFHAQTASAGRWEISRPVNTRKLDEALNEAFDRYILLCKETAKNIDWGKALEILRIWEYSGLVRRGYFIKGLSGAQFIRQSDFTYAQTMLNGDDESLIWLNAADNIQLWGKVLKHETGYSFTNIASTAVCLYCGKPAAVFERGGAVLRIFDFHRLDDLLKAFAESYYAKRLFSDKKRITVKEYPEEAENSLVNAGFIKQMNDYVIWAKAF